MGDILEWAVLAALGLAGLAMLVCLIAWIGLAVAHIIRAFTHGTR